MKDMQSDWVEEQFACNSLVGAGGCKEDRQGCLTQTLFKRYFKTNIIYIYKQLYIYKQIYIYIVFSAYSLPYFPSISTPLIVFSAPLDTSTPFVFGDYNCITAPFPFLLPAFPIVTPGSFSDS